MPLEIIVILSSGTAAFLLVWVCVHAISLVMRKEEARMTSRVERVQGGDAFAEVSLLKQEMLSGIGWFHSLLSMVKPMQGLRVLILQAGIDINPGTIVLASLSLSMFGFLFLHVVHIWAAVAAGLCGLVLPVTVVKYLKTRRMERFVNQLPDALDTLARALQSGHALSSGLRMIADDYSAPLGKEFDTMLQEVNFGISMEKALSNLAERVDVQDLRFFVTSLMIQRETGGNLSDLVQTIAYLIRERFKLEGKVRVLTAECRISAVILFMLPLGLAIFMQMFNPEYLSMLYTTDMGIMLIKYAGILMITGLLVIRKMIKVKV